MPVVARLMVWLLTVATLGMAQTQTPGSLLPSLVGSWTFTLGTSTGVREVRRLFSDYAIEFRESFSNGSREGYGLLTFDARRGRYLSMGVHNVPGAADASVGELQPDGRTIVFRPLLPDLEVAPTESWLIVESTQSFRYELRQRTAEAWQIVWTARFTRVGR